MNSECCAKKYSLQPKYYEKHVSQNANYFSTLRKRALSFETLPFDNGLFKGGVCGSNPIHVFVKFSKHVLTAC